MKLDAAKWRLTSAMIFSIVAASIGAEPSPLAAMKDLHATDFTSEQYFEPPYERQVKMRLSGAAAEPLPGGLLDVKRLKIETFSTNNAAVAVVRAPQCTFAPLDGVASSAGHLELQTGDGKFRVEGDGFLWRQNESALTISNRVRTVIAVDIFSEKKTAL